MFVEVGDIYKSYTKNKLCILKGVNFCIKAGECTGLIGKSGSGKSTLSRLMLGLEKPDSGSILIEGDNVNTWIKKNRGGLSVVFQDYTSSVNPRFTVKKIIAEPMLAIGKKENILENIKKLLLKVGLSVDLLDRYPHELSGGQMQRVCIARAVSTNPRFLVLDEPISSLDVSMQAQIIELLKKLKSDMNMTYLFIAHDLQAVVNLCDTILFLHNGKVVENVSKDKLSQVKNEYARELLDSVMYFNI